MSPSALYCVGRARAVALGLADDVSGGIVGVRLDQVAAGVGQLAQPAHRVVDVIGREPSLIDYLGDVAVDAVLNRERAVRLGDRGRQVLAVVGERPVAAGAVGGQHVAVAVVGVGIRRAVGQVFGRELAVGVVGVA